MTDIKSMKNPSFVLEKVNEVKFEDRPVPELKDPHYVKVEVKKTGICGSDVHYYTHGSIGDFVVKAPMVLGHESAGIVTEVGSAVTGLKVGDRVAMEPGIPSRYSEEYKAGRYNLCPHMAFAATPPYDGTLARYYLLPEDFCVKLPENVSLEEGALVEPLSVGIHVNRLAGTTFGSKVVVFGAGPIGLLCAATAKAYGATRVAIVDIVESRVKFALDFGATDGYVVSRGDSAVETAKKLEAQLGFKPELALECSGAESSIAAAVHVLKAGGTMVQAGMGKDEITFPIAQVAAKELTLKGSFRYYNGDYPRAVELIASGKIDVKKLVTHRIKFEDCEAGFKTVMEGKAIKLIIDGPE